MKSILTKLTESIGNSIATNSNKNEFIEESGRMEAYHISGNTGGPTLTDLSGKDLARILNKENPELLKQLQKHLASSKECKKIKPKKKKSSSRSSSSSSVDWSNGGCGSSSTAYRRQ